MTRRGEWVEPDGIRSYCANVLSLGGFVGLVWDFKVCLTSHCSVPTLTPAFVLSLPSAGFQPIFPRGVSISVAAESGNGNLLNLYSVLSNPQV